MLGKSFNNEQILDWGSSEGPEPKVYPIRVRNFEDYEEKKPWDRDFPPNGHMYPVLKEHLADCRRTDQLFDMLSHSPTFIGCMQDIKGLKRSPVMYYIGDKNQTNGKVIKGIPQINRSRGFYEAIATTAHEVVGHMRQNWLGIPDGASNLFAFISQTKLREADADATAVTICHELLTKGFPKPWHDFADRKPIIAESYLSAVHKNPLSTCNGVAQNKAFLGWFKSFDLQTYYSMSAIRMYLKSKPHEHVGSISTLDLVQRMRRMPFQNAGGEIVQRDLYLSEAGIPQLYGTRTVLREFFKRALRIS